MTDHLLTEVREDGVMVATPEPAGDPEFVVG